MARIVADDVHGLVRSRLLRQHLRAVRRILVQEVAVVWVLRW